MKNLVIEGPGLERLLVSATEAIVIIDREGTIVLANPAFEQLFGYGQDALLGKLIEVLVPARFQRAHSGQCLDYLFGLHRDGRGLELTETEMRPGERRMFTGMVRDITERKQAEAKSLRPLHEVRGATERQDPFPTLYHMTSRCPCASSARWRTGCRAIMPISSTIKSRNTCDCGDGIV